MQSDFALLQLKAASLNDTIEMLIGGMFMKLSNLGFTFICKCNLGKECYVFNNDKRILTFSQEDKRNLLFTNKMYF